VVKETAEERIEEPFRSVHLHPIYGDYAVRTDRVAIGMACPILSMRLKAQPYEQSVRFHHSARAPKAVVQLHLEIGEHNSRRILPCTH